MDHVLEPAGGSNGDWFPVPGQDPLPGGRRWFSTDHFNKHVAAVSRNPERLHLFVIGFEQGALHNRVWTTFWVPAIGWEGDWFAPGQVVFDAVNQQITAVARTPDQLDLFVIGFDGHVWSTAWGQIG